MSRRLGVCTFCGQKRKMTRDHVPPKGIFATPRPRNLITVGACRKCNSSRSKDDEYFKIMLLLRRDTYIHPDVSRLVMAVGSSLRRRDREGLRASLMRSFARRDIHTEAGIYLGTADTMNVDMTRIRSVVEHTVQGLFVHHTKRRISDPSCLRVFPYDDYGYYDESTKKMYIDFASGLMRREEVTMGNNTFSYWHQFFDEDEDSSAWLLRYYGSVFFLILSAKDEFVEKHKTSRD